MAFDTIKIAELPSATQVVGDDFLVVEQPDKTKKATAFQVISDLDLANKSSLTGPGGAAIIGTEDGQGVQKSLDTDRANTRELWRRALHDLGLTLVDGSFEEGAELTYTTDAIWHMAGAQCYTWSGTFPKSVPAGSTPSNTGSEWLTVGGLSLLDEVTEIKNEAVEAKDEAVEAKNQAEAYVLQASEFGNLYPNTAAGLAATTSGQYFQVPQGSGSSVAFKVYKNNAGVAQEVAAAPGTGAIISTIREFPTLAAAQADADAGNILSGATAFYRSPDDSVLAIEVINNAGTLTATGRKMPSYDSLKRSNILFDAFNEQSAEQLNFASWDWYKGATPAFSTTDVNLPLPTPVIQASGVTSFDKYYDVSKLQVKPGDTLAFSVLVWFENAGGKLQIYWLDSAGATITTGEASPLVAGISSPVVVIAVPSGASLIGTHSGATVQQVLDSLSNSWQNLYYFSTTGNEVGTHVDTIALSPVQRTYGVQISTPLASFSPKVDNVLSNGTTSLRWSQVYAVNSVISTSNKKKKTNLRQITPTEAKAFYEIGKLDSVWQWLSKYSSEKGAARLHSGPTVQDAIKVMLKHGLDWTKYSAFCYDSWEANGDTPAGEEFAFRKEELLFWILRATIAVQEDLDKRLSALEKSLPGN
ncbi:tail spike protein [Klebsiella phage vB_KpnM_NDO71]|nr:tail spike protein [Klebsiella phage vB_KpnM_NDO71]